MMTVHILRSTTNEDPEPVSVITFCGEKLHRYSSSWIYFHGVEVLVIGGPLPASERICPKCWNKILEHINGEGKS